MRIAVLGGTKFIGRAIVDNLVSASHDVLVIHRGETEPPDLPRVQHLHVDRNVLPDREKEILTFRPQAFIDTRALTASDADLALKTFPNDVRAFVLSSADVYRGYEGLQEGIALEAVPFTEESPVREKRYPYRGKIDGLDDYEKLDVEEAYLARNGTVLRLPFVYGEHDYQRREWFVLGRIRAGRRRMPFGAGNFLGTRIYVRDAARGVRLALEAPHSSVQIFNLGEPSCLSMQQLAEAIVEAAGAKLELVQVRDELLPPDLQITGAVRQHFLLDSSKARGMLGWETRDLKDALKATVEWHLANPPESENLDYSADDTALAAN